MILITRHQDEAWQTVELLQARGYETHVDSQLDIQPQDAGDLPDALQAALFTSMNAVGFVDPVMMSQVPKTLVVGKATAERAMARSFHNVEYAHGNVESLLELCKKELRPEDGPVVHFCGDVTRGNLVERLKLLGLDAHERVVYKSVAKMHLDLGTIELLKGHKITSALFFSPRTAKVFMENLNRHGLGPCVKTLTAFCLSQAVAEPLRNEGWGRVCVSRRPEQEALLDLLD